MTGNSDALHRIIAGAQGPAGVVKNMSEAVREFANEHWSRAIQLMVPIMSEHEKLWAVAHNVISLSLPWLVP